MSEHVMDTALGAKKNWPKKLAVLRRDVPSKNLKKTELQAISILKKRLQKTMWQCVGIVRTKKLLTKALKQIQQMQKQLSKIAQTHEKNSQTNPAALELQNMLQVAALIIKAALKRKKSLGAHYRKN